MTFDTNVFNAFNENAKKYFQRFQTDQQYHAWYNKFVSLLDSQVCILDVGCGPGITAFYILEQLPNAHILGIDLSPNMIELAKEHSKHMHNIKFEVMNCLDINTIENTFNVVFSSFVIPYLNTELTESLITQCCDKVESGGHLFLSWITHPELKQETSNSSDGKYKLTMYYHNKENLIQMLNQKGFKIVFSDDQVEPSSQKTECCLVAQRN